MDRGPLLTSAIIFYLAIGAAIFEVLEEPHWKEAKKSYYTEKLHLLKEFPCLGQEGLDKILQVSRGAPAARRAAAAWSSGRAAETPLGWGAVGWGGVTGQNGSACIWPLGSAVQPCTQASPRAEPRVSRD